MTSDHPTAERQHDERSVAPESLSTSDERTWSGLAHFGGILSFVGPLIVLLMYRDRSTVVSREAKESLNFQITVTLVSVVLYVLGGALALVAFGLIFIAIAPFVQLAGVVFAIVGGVRTNSAGTFSYPFAIRLFR